MNLNPVLMRIGEAVGLPTAEDEYEGREEKYLIFTYEDERPDFWGDDRVLADTVNIMLQMVVPKSFNYMKLKKKLVEELEKEDFSITGIHSLFGESVNRTEKIRRIVFETVHTEMRQEEK